MTLPRRNEDDLTTKRALVILESECVPVFFTNMYLEEGLVYVSPQTPQS